MSVCLPTVYSSSHQVAAEIAAPLSQTKKITMISSGKGDVGAAKLTTEVLDIMEKLPKVVEDLTGVDVTKVRTYGEVSIGMCGQTWFNQ